MTAWPAAKSLTLHVVHLAEVRTCALMFALKPGLSEWVEVHQGKAEEIATDWAAKIDLLIFDGDQSPAEARAAFERWSPWLKPGGVIALHNSNPREYQVDHDGHYRLAIEEIQLPCYIERQLVDSTTFAVRAPTIAGRKQTLSGGKRSKDLQAGSSAYYFSGLFSRKRHPVVC